MKKFFVFSLSFLLGACVLLGGAIIASDLMRRQNAFASTAYIDASAVEPASGTGTVADLPKDDGNLIPPTTPEGSSAVEDVDTTHPILRLTPDKTEMVPLDRDAQSVIIGNPDHASVLIENPRLLLFVPRNPGATHVTILDKDGAIVMQRHVVVSAPREKYVRIRRSCANASRQGNCQPISVYYCPDMCHEVSVDANSSGPRR